MRTQVWGRVHTQGTWINSGFTRKDRCIPSLLRLAVLKNPIGAVAALIAEGRTHNGVQAVSGVLRPHGDYLSTALEQEGTLAFEKRMSRHAGSLHVSGRRGDGRWEPHVVPANAPDGGDVPSLHPPSGRWAEARQSFGKCCPEEVTCFL